jgi:dTDP-4-amino-4,6-dideoxygalactose transaminase
VLRIKLAHIETWTKGRQQNAKRYGELFRHYELLDAIELPAVLPDRRHVYNQYCVRVKAGQRDDVLNSLREQKVGATIYYPVPLHLQECFADLGYKPGDLPESETACAEVLALPIFPELTADKQEIVVRSISKALGRFNSTATPEPKYLKPHERAA